MTRPSANELVEHTVKHLCGHTCFWSASQAAHEALGPVDGSRFLGGLSTVPCVWCDGTVHGRLHGMLNGQGFDWLVSKTPTLDHPRQNRGQLFWPLADPRKKGRIKKKR